MNNILIKQYLSKTVSNKLLSKYKNSFSNENLLSLHYFYWFYKTEYKHIVEGVYVKKKKSFSINSFFLISYFKSIKVYQVFFINSPFLFFIHKTKNNFKALKKIFFFKDKK
jgi:hypothetical protein